MAPESRDGVPGRDEVRQRIDSLYDQAENATGNYNATRAMASVKRSRGVPLAKRRRPDPALDEVARQWFEAARAKLGPTVPAVLPADRLPDAPPAERRGRDRWGGTPDAPGLAARRTEALERAAERTVAELTAGRPTDPESLALAARESARAALPGPRRPELPGGAGDFSGPIGEVRGGGGDGGTWGTGGVQPPGPAALTAPAGQATPAGPGALTAPAGPGALTAAAGSAGLMAPTGSAGLMAPTGSAALTAPLAGGVPAGLGPVEPAGLGPLQSGGPGTVNAAGPGAGLPSGLGTSEPGGLDTVLPAGLGTADPTGLSTGLPSGLGSSGPGGLDTGLPAGLDTAQPAGLGTGLTVDPGAAVSGALGGARVAGLGPAETAVLPVTALSDAQGTPAQGPSPFPGVARSGRTSPGASKAANQRKLAAASDVLSRYTARLTTSTAAAHAASVTAAEPPRSMTASPAPAPAPGTDVPPASVTSSPSFTAATPGPVTATAAPPAPDTGGSPAMAPPPPPFTVAEPAPAPAPPASAPAAAPVAAAPPASVMAPPPPPFTAVPPASATGTPPPAAVPAAPAAGQWPGSQWAESPAPEPWTTAPDAMASMTGTGSLHPVAGSPRAARAAKAIAFARAQIGKPCVWGATGPDSYDCSSLTQAAWRAAGVELPRAAYRQALAGAPVTLAGIEPGDLVLFFDDDRHVGLYTGGGMMVHAPGPGASIREESIYGAGESAIHRIVRPA